MAEEFLFGHGLEGEGTGTDTGDEAEDGSGTREGAGTAKVGVFVLVDSLFESLAGEGLTGFGVHLAAVTGTGIPASKDSDEGSLARGLQDDGALVGDVGTRRDREPVIVFDTESLDRFDEASGAREGSEATFEAIGVGAHGDEPLRRGVRGFRGQQGGYTVTLLSVPWGQEGVIESKAIGKELGVRGFEVHEADKGSLADALVWVVGDDPTLLELGEELEHGSGALEVGLDGLLGGRCEDVGGRPGFILLAGAGSPLEKEEGLGGRVLEDFKDGPLKFLQGADVDEVFDALLGEGEGGVFCTQGMKARGSGTGRTAGVP